MWYCYGAVKSSTSSSPKKLKYFPLGEQVISVGYTEEEIDVMDRDAMLATWVEWKDKPETVTLPTVGYDVQLEREKQAQHELKMHETESQEKLKRAEIEAQKSLNRLK